MSPFDRVLVIFNPHGTGEAPQLAEELRADLAERLPDMAVQLAPTEQAGHARDLARDAATTGRPRSSRSAVTAGTTRSWTG